jgi:hypothetical protein
MGLLGVEFPSRYGGNIRVFMGNDSAGGKGVENREQLEAREACFLGDFSVMSDHIEGWKRAKKKAILGLVEKHGRLRAKAFPGRAAILVKLLELDKSIVSVVYEKPGSLKIGHYLPGTRIPIHSDQEWIESEDKSAPMLNLAWHIPDEIRSYMREQGYTGEIIDILGAEDFVSGD